MNPLARARIRTARELAKQGYGPLYESIHSILAAHNPANLDLTRGDARDDYGLPTGTLIPRLKEVDEQNLRDVLYAEMQHWYREKAGTPEQYDGVARAVWQSWLEFSQRFHTRSDGMPHEEQFHKFVIPEKQERYAQHLRSRKHRKKLLDRLNHNADFNPKFLLRLANDDQDELAIFALLQRRGAPDECYVISTNENIDGHRMPLVQALSKTVAMGYGTVISCIPGKLGYYEGEDPGERYLLVCP